MMSRDKLRIGVIGAGGRGTIAANWANSDRAEVVATADTNPEGHDEFARAAETEDFKRFEDYRELLKCDEVEAVCITTPDWLHEEHAIAALCAGKHVYCEKPLAISVEGCDRILETVRSTGLKFMIGFNMRYMNMVRVMKEIVDSGAIGEVKAAWCRHFVGHGGKFYYHDWHARRENGTSLLLQKASHDIDVIHWICGSFTKRVVGLGALSYYGGEKPDDLICPECPERDSCPDTTAELSTSLSPHQRKKVRCAFRKEVDVEDNQTIIMQLENGVQACYMQNHFTPDYFRNYTFIGTEGRLENMRAPGEEASMSTGHKLVRVWTRRKGDWKHYSNRDYHVKPAEEGSHSGADPRICQDFTEYVLDDKQPITSAAAGRMSVAVGCLGAESMRAGGMPKDVPPLAPELMNL
jgi:predicted dehydrogenase